MPPKRTRQAKTERELEPLTHATRSSSRATATVVPESASTTNTASATIKPQRTTRAKPTSKVVAEESDDEEPPKKRAKSSTTSTKAKKTIATATKKTNNASEAVANGDHNPSFEDRPIKPKKATAKNAPASKSKTPAETYTHARALELFSNYADSDDPDVIGPEGCERLFTDANISLEGAMPLLLAWQFGAKEMAKFTKDEWVAGTSILKISSLAALNTILKDLDGLLIRGPRLPVKVSPKGAPYDTTLYVSYASNVKDAFRKFYTFCFALVKPEQSRNIDMETSLALWSVLLVPKYPLMQEIVDFINKNISTYRATTKDLWQMMLAFCDTVDPSFKDYDADAAWPTLLDSFVASKQCVA